MTLDVTIGEIYLDKDLSEIKPIYWVRCCPESETEICDEEYTLWTKESYRSGSSSFWKFFKEDIGDIYYEMREHPYHNDHETAYLKSFIDRINALPTPEDEFNQDRMKWFKYWCNKAVELYGDKAAIMFG